MIFEKKGGTKPPLGLFIGYTTRSWVHEAIKIRLIGHERAPLGNRAIFWSVAVSQTSRSVDEILKRADNFPRTGAWREFAKRLDCAVSPRFLKVAASPPLKKSSPPLPMKPAAADNKPKTPRLRGRQNKASDGENNFPSRARCKLPTRHVDTPA